LFKSVLKTADLSQGQRLQGQGHGRGHVNQGQGQKYDIQDQGLDCHSYT